MNSAVGCESPAWICIESIKYDKEICAVDMPLGISTQHKYRPSIKVVIKSPKGETTSCDSIAAAAKIMGRAHEHVCRMMCTRDIYVFRDGWQIVKAKL
jgi:hypothetical protein